MTEAIPLNFLSDPRTAELEFPRERYKNTSKRSWRAARERAKLLHIPSCNKGSPKSGQTLWNNVNKWAIDRAYRQEVEDLYKLHEDDRAPHYECSGKAPTDEEVQQAIQNN